MTNRTAVREARRTLSAILASGKTVAIGGPYELRGFIVGLPPHSRWNTAEKRKAIAAAKNAFAEAIRAEAQT